MDEKHKIDRFEKLYILISAQEAAKENGVALVSDEISEEDFENICTFAEYKEKHKDEFSGEEGIVKEQDYNYYVIPQTKEYTVRNGSETISEKKQINIVSDNVGNSLFIIMDDGSVTLTKKLQQEIAFANERYKNEIERGEIPDRYIDNIFEVNSIDDITRIINNEGFSFDNIQAMIDKILVEKGFVLNRVRDNDNDKDNNSEEEQEEKDIEKDEEYEEEQEEDIEEQEDIEVEKEKTIEERADELGVSKSFLETIAEKYKCRPDQIDFRHIENYEKLQEDIGLNLRKYRGKVVAIKIRYGYQERLFLINSETGERFQPHLYENGHIPELEEYFKYPIKRGENARALRKDEGRSYITYLDEYGNMKEMKYINNGRKDDMQKEERERYIAEVKEANEILQNVIDVYQRDCTQENWLRVKDAMKARIDVDRKYKIKERGFNEQKKSTIDTLDEVVDETIKKHPMKEGMDEIEI